MTPEEKQLLEDLQKRVEELESEKRERDQQYIPFPLDVASVRVIARALQDAGYIIT